MNRACMIVACLTALSTGADARLPEWALHFPTELSA